MPRLRTPSRAPNLDLGVAAHWSFAKPYKGLLILGFVLTLLSHRRHLGAALSDDSADG